MIAHIDDPDDLRLDDYRRVKERDLVGRDGRFIAEGRVVLEKAVDADRVRLLSVLVADHRLGWAADILARLPDETPVYAASQAVMDTVVGFSIHRGLLAVGERIDMDAGALLAGLPERARLVALSGVSNHDNMGGVFRNCAAFGVDAVLLDSDCCDPLYRKAIRVSVGATLITPFAKVAGDLVAPLAAAGFEVLSLSPRGEVELTDLKPAPRTAVVFGAEGPGLAPEVLARTRTVRIAMHGGFDSLNVATTSGIVLHHISR